MANNVRIDKRRNDELRALKISYDGLARVDGSARFGFGMLLIHLNIFSLFFHTLRPGDTAALASLSGPIEVRLAAESPSKATFEVMVRPLSNVPATDAKSLGASIRSTLEPSLILTKNPRTLVQLVVQSLSPASESSMNQSLSAAMVNASSLALLKAGSVPMNGVVCAVAIGKSSCGSFVVDPSEEENLDAGGCFAFLFADEVGLSGSNSDCVWTSWKATKGKYDQAELVTARELARSAAGVVYGEMRKTFDASLHGAVHPATDTQVKVEPPVAAEEEAEEEEEDDDDKMDI